MSFSASIAKKYIFAQKRHSALTVFSIAAAVALITLLFTIYSTYSASMLDHERRTDPWHAVLFGLTREQAEKFVSTGEFADHEFEEEAFAYTFEDGTTETVRDSKLRLKFTSDTHDCDEVMESAANAAGFSFKVDYPPYSYYYNNSLLRLENIGIDAKAYNIQIFALFYVFILFVIFFSRLVIDTAFEISSKEREKQFGVFQSIGASKNQIAAIMTWEGGFLSLIGIPLGLIAGLGASYLLYLGVKSGGVAQSLKESGAIGDIIFSVSPLFIQVVIVTGLMWVLFSAYGTGMRVAKMSPVEAIRSRGTEVSKVKRRSVFGLIFGWAGLLAARNIRRGKKRFIITILSMTLSIVLFVSFVYVIDILVSETEMSNNGSDYAFSISEIAKKTDEDGDGIPEHESRSLTYRRLDQLLNDSGYFENVMCVPSAIISTDIDAQPISDELAGFLGDSYTDKVWICVNFVDEILYKRIMGGNPEVSYSQLSEENGYVLLNAAKIDPAYTSEEVDAEKVFDAFYISRGDTISGEIYYNVHLDEPITVEYEDENGNIFTEETDQDYRKDEFDLKILDISEERNGIIDSWAHGVCLLATYDQYDEFFFKYAAMQQGYEDLTDVCADIWVTADLREGADYNKAMSFLEGYGLQTIENNYSMRLADHNKVIMVKMIGYTLIALISLIAVINMVNVVSTGIINRRPEIAAMKSLGMSKKQLIKMILIECGQYALVSGISAIALSELLLFLTFKSMDLFSLSAEEQRLLIDYSKPAVYALMAMAAAFIFAVLAAIFPIREIEKSSITEEMKRID